MRYHDFDLWIAKGEGGIVTLRSRCDEHGESNDKTVQDPAALQREAAPLAHQLVDKSVLIEIGTRLYAATFVSGSGSIEWHFAQCWGATKSRAEGVRVRFRVEEPDLASIPWEYIYSNRFNDFLGVSSRTPIVRYLELPQAIGSLETQLPVHMLVAIPGRSGLDTEREKRELETALDPLREIVRITTLEGEVSRERIGDTLRSKPFDLFHFIGHGDFQGDRAALLLNRTGGGDELVDHERVAHLFRDYPSMKLVVLNSCRGAQLSAAKPFVGMAAELVKFGVPAVIAMQYEILDQEAIQFSKTLYRELFMGQERGRIEVAISRARSELADAFPNTNALGLPVLFTHAREGVLFEVITGSVLRDLPVSGRARERAQAVIRTHERNLAILDKESAEPAREGDVRRSTEQAALQRARRVLRLRDAAIAIAAAVAMMLILSAGFFGFLRISRVFRPETYWVLFSDLIGSHRDAPAVTVVAIDSASTAAFMSPSPDSTWRGRHSVVLRHLLQAGARVVAFNLSFNRRASPQMQAWTDSLVAAVQAARDQHATVIVAADSMVGGVPITEPALLEAGAGWGVNCYKAVPRISANAITILVAKAAPGGSDRLHSLELETVAAFRHSSVGATGPVRQTLNGSKIGVLDSLLATQPDSQCGTDRGDTLYRMVLDYTSRRQLRDPTHRLSYLNVWRGADVGNLSGRIVLVGFENPGTTVRIVRGFHSETRSRLELVADAMNTMLRGVRIAPLGAGWQFIVILAMAGLGAMAALAGLRFGRTGQAVTLFISLVAYVVAGSAVYARQHALLNTAFDLLALFLTFIAVVLVRRTWFP